MSDSEWAEMGRRGLWLSLLLTVLALLEHMMAHVHHPHIPVNKPVGCHLACALQGSWVAVFSKGLYDSRRVEEGGLGITMSEAH